MNPGVTLGLAGTPANRTPPTITSTPHLPDKNASSVGSPSLSADQIAAAVAKGVKNPGQPQGLLLEDAMGQTSQLLAGLAAATGAPLSPGTQVPGKGFRAWAFTPLAWISEQASEAVSHGRSFTTSDVTQDMVRPVFRVRAYPSTRPDTGPNYGQGVSPVVNVVIKDASRKEELDPTRRQPFTYQGMQGQLVEFAMEDLNRIRQKNREFFIVVIGTGINTTDFKVKKKHFSQLP
jgi:hypothetical protein